MGDVPQPVFVSKIQFVPALSNCTAERYYELFSVRARYVISTSSYRSTNADIFNYQLLPKQILLRPSWVVKGISATATTFRERRRSLDEHDLKLGALRAMILSRAIFSRPKDISPLGQQGGRFGRGAIQRSRYVSPGERASMERG